MLRVTNSTIFDRVTTQLNLQQARLNETQEKITTGRNILKPSDAPDEVAALDRLESSVRQADRFVKNIGIIKDTLGLQELAITSLNDNLSSAKTLLVQAANGTISDTNRDAIAIELQAIYDNMLSVGNYKNVDGSYLFAGSAQEQPPFSASKNPLTATRFSDFYAGNDQIHKVAMDEGFLIDVGLTGSQLFAGVTKESAVGSSVAQVVSVATTGLEKTHSLTLAGQTYSANTLAGLHDAINNETDSHGVTASIAGLALTLTGKSDGTSFSVGSTMTVTRNSINVPGVLTTEPLIEVAVATPQVSTFTTTTTTGSSFVLNVNGNDYAANSLAQLAVDIQAAGIGITATEANGVLTLTGDVTGASFVSSDLIVTNGSGAVETVSENVNTQGVPVRAAQSQVTTISPTTAVGTAFVLNLDGQDYQAADLSSLATAITDAANGVNAAIVNNELVLTGDALGTSFTAGDLVVTQPQALVSVQTQTQPVVADLNTDIFSIMKSAIYALQNNDQQAIQSSIDDIGSALTHVNVYLNRVGSRMSSAESQLNVLNDRSVMIEQIISQIQDLDYITAVSEMKNQSIALQAGQQSFAMISNLSLFNYLK